MSIQTTCIGAYPKPEYITTGNWSETEEQNQDALSFTYTNEAAETVSKKLLDQ